jgi:hypothetical protein
VGTIRLFALTVCVTAIVGVGASAALAGEVNGSKNGKDGSWAIPGAQNASSACAFSGLEDSELEGAVPGIHGVVQNWGHTKDSGAVVDNPDNHGAALVHLDFGGGEFIWGCNPHVGAAG